MYTLYKKNIKIENQHPDMQINQCYNVNAYFKHANKDMHTCSADHFASYRTANLDANYIE